MMSSGASISGSSTKSGSTKGHKVSSGRGGLGNIVYTSVLASDLKYEAEILLRRRMQRGQPATKKVNTGRGGTGNIAAASAAQLVPFDKSADPDDSYEEIIAQENRKSRKISSTGRGGAGNLSGPKFKEARKNRRRATSVPASSASSSSNNSIRYSWISQLGSPASSPPVSPVSAPISSPILYTLRPLPASQSTPSFIMPHVLDTHGPPEANITLNDSREKARWWKFKRQQNDRQRKSASQELPKRNSVLDIRMRRGEVDEQIPPRRPQIYTGERRVFTETHASPVSPEYRMGRFFPAHPWADQAEARADEEEDDDEDDEELWQLEVLQEAENEIDDSFLDF